MCSNKMFIETPPVKPPMKPPIKAPKTGTGIKAYPSRQPPTLVPIPVPAPIINLLYWSLLDYLLAV